MSKKHDSAKTLLSAALSGAKQDYLIDADSLDFAKLNEIVTQKLYDSIVDIDTIWDLIFHKSFKFADVKSDRTVLRDFTPEQKAQIVDEVSAVLADIPTKYILMFPIPSRYPSGNKNLIKDVDIIKFSEKEISDYDASNPQNSLDKLINSSSKLIPTQDRFYLSIIDSGYVRPGGIITLESRHDPLRIFRLYTSLQAISDNLSFKEMSRQTFIPRAYLSTKKFVANIPNSIDNDGPFSGCSFKDGRKKEVELVDEIYSKVLTARNDALEGIRVQLSNCLHWYFEYLNTKDVNLRIVFLVSSFDSLFSIRKDSRTKKLFIPTVKDIAPVIAEANSSNFIELEQIIKTIESLYSSRNNVIHGRKEIQSFRRTDVQERVYLSSLVSSAESVLKEYSGRQIRKYLDSI